MQVSRIPLELGLKAIVASVMGGRRSSRADGRQVWNSQRPRPRLAGLHHLPASGPYIVVGNHFNGPGVWVGFAAALIASAVGSGSSGSRIRVVGVTSYRNFKMGFVAVPSRLTRCVFARFYRVYGMIEMPHAGEGKFSRAAAVRSILRALREGDVIILFPEGGNVRDFIMRRIEPGVGDLLRLASKQGCPIVPCALSDRQDGLCLAFGPPINVGKAQSSEQVEEATGQAIASLLPRHNRGPYARVPEG